MNKIIEALALATAVHAGQVDKSGEPYMRHIMRVWAMAKSRGLDVSLQIVAILHDTMEDDTTGVITPYFIASLFGWDVAHTVNDLTRNKNESYIETYIAGRVKGNADATAVKILDLSDHLNRLAGDESSTIPYNTKIKMRARYTEAMLILGSTVDRPSTT